MRDITGLEKFPLFSPLIIHLNCTALNQSISSSFFYVYDDDDDDDDDEDDEDDGDGDDDHTLFNEGNYDY